MNIKELLTTPKIQLEWVEPWEGRDASGKSVFTHIILRATVTDCICMQRKKSNDLRPSVLYSDEELLSDFVAINWANEVSPPALR